MYNSIIKRIEIRQGTDTELVLIEKGPISRYTKQYFLNITAKIHDEKYAMVLTAQYLYNETENKLKMNIDHTKLKCLETTCKNELVSNIEIKNLLTGRLDRFY